MFSSIVAWKNVLLHDRMVLCNNSDPNIENHVWSLYWSLNITKTESKLPTLSASGLLSNDAGMIFPRQDSWSTQSSRTVAMWIASEPLNILLGNVWSVNEPSHEIMALFVLRKLILQTRMRSHPVGLDVWFLVGPFDYFHTSCGRTVKALARLHGCAGSPKPSPVVYVISTIISWASSNYDSVYICFQYMSVSDSIGFSEKIVGH